MRTIGLAMELPAWTAVIRLVNLVRASIWEVKRDDDQTSLV